MFRTYNNLGRLLHMARVLARHDVLVPREYASLAPAWLRLLAGLLGRPRDPASKLLLPGERLAKALEQLGPSAIKIGQVLATRPDLLGPEMTRGLESLQDRLPPFPEGDARLMVEADLGRPLADIFSTFSPPVAAASIAQVHEAQTNDNPPVHVAVKVQRPNIIELFARDFEAFRLAASIIEQFSSEGRRMRAKAMVEILARSVAIELDLRMEAAAASELQENMRDEAGFRVPLVDWSRTSARVLTAEWVEGISLRDADALRAAGHDPKRIAVVVLQIFLKQALRDGFFHADLHPGNLFVDAQGHVCAVDFGIMGRLDPPMRRFLAETLGGFLARDYMRVAIVHFEAGFVPRTHNVETFAQAIRAVGEPIFGLTARDVSMARLLDQLFATTRRFDMEAQPQLMLLQKTMMVVEGVCRVLDPEFDIWESSRPVIEEWMVKNLGPEARLRDAADGLTSLGKLAQNFPQLVRDTEVIAAQLADGGLRLHPDSVLAIAVAQQRRARHVRIAIWIAACALGVLALRQL